MNMSTSQIQVCVTMYYHLLEFIKEHRESFGQNWSRISEYDHIAFDVLQVFVVKHIVNIVMKFRSYDEDQRNDALTSAQLNLILVSQFFLKRKSQTVKQFEHTISEVCNWHSKIKKEKECFISTQEIDTWQSILQKLKKGGAKEIYIEKDQNKAFPQEVKD